MKRVQRFLPGNGIYSFWSLWKFERNWWSGLGVGRGSLKIYSYLAALRYFYTWRWLAKQIIESTPSCTYSSPSSPTATPWNNQQLWDTGHIWGCDRGGPCTSTNFSLGCRESLAPQEHVLMAEVLGKQWALKITEYLYGILVKGWD